MNFPINLDLGSLQISYHLIFETLGFLLGFQYYLHLRKKEKDLLTSEERYWILIAVVIGALFFSRFVAVMEHIKLVNENTPFLFYYSQKTIVGGLVGGLIAVEITKKILNIKHSSGDIMTYPLILGIMIGRIGCFLAGLEDGTFGIETNLPWGIDFGDGIKRHPTQIYEILFLLCLWLFLILIEKKIINSFSFNKIFELFFLHHKIKDGLKFKFFLSFYLLFRLIIEFIKPVDSFLFHFSFIQITCLLVLIYYLFLIQNYFYMRKKNS